MEHKGTMQLETERLILRRFVREDASTAYRNWTSDARTTEFLRWPTHGSVETTEGTMSRWVDAYTRPDFYQWAIVPRDVGEPIGTISSVGMDEKVGSVEIGYCIGSPWWGRGYVTEAMAAVMAFFFDEVGANRVESSHDPNNPGSGRVMQKCGMKHEGIRRQADFNNRGIVDSALYGMLASEWRLR